MRRILVPLDPSPHSDEAIRYACMIAREHGAILVGLGVHDASGIADSLSQVKNYQPDYAAGKEAEALAESHAILKKMARHFGDVCLDEQVLSRFEELEGVPAEVIADYAGFFDLVVVSAKSNFNFESSCVYGEALKHVVAHSVTPVMVIPDGVDAEKHHQVLIAYDGSRVAKRAIKDYVRVWRHDEHAIRIVMVHDDEAIARAMLIEARGYLKAHGLEHIETIHSTEAVIPTFTGAHYDWADLVVLGAHTKKSLMDFAIGSLSRELIGRADKPLFVGL